MKRLSIALISGVFATALVQCSAEAACTQVTVLSRVAAARAELTLADLLTQGGCTLLHQEAAQVSLGAAPRAGSVRVLDGRQIRRLVEKLAGDGSRKEAVAMQVPERIVVQQAVAMKSCSEIARFVASTSASQGIGRIPRRWQDNLDCAAAQAIPEHATLELAKATWNAALQRWEFGMRCNRAEDCVPFLVWTSERNTSAAGTAKAQPGNSDPRLSPDQLSTLFPPQESERLVKAGQTATLSWDQGGIRIVLPVTCLDGGGLGQFVRVRFKNTARILRAEVLSDGTLRATL